ncbi:MAG TPA: hypothetical protein VF660_00940 [Actinomycetota bacterium]
MQGFRISLVLGVAVIVVLAVAGLFPVALIAAAILIPLITVLYLYDVDLYEDEPLRVIAFTMAWGVVTGILVGLVARAMTPSAGAALGATTGSRALKEGLLIPIIAVVVMLAGPLILLPYRKFNDVLDGATFGAASAVSFAGALVITEAVGFLGAGLRPIGAVWPWLFRLLALGVAIPILYAGSIGSASAAFWLRYRAPARDRSVLGALGHPVSAVLLAAALVVAGSVLEVLLSPLLSLLCLIVLDAVALVWLRRVIHLGLLEEAAEKELGPEIACPNCGQATPSRGFCVNCGVSLVALPKARAGASPPTAAETMP